MDVESHVPATSQLSSAPLRSALRCLRSTSEGAPRDAIYAAMQRQVATFDDTTDPQEAHPFSKDTLTVDANSGHAHGVDGLERSKPCVEWQL